MIPGRFFQMFRTLSDFVGRSNKWTQRNFEQTKSARTSFRKKLFKIASAGSLELKPAIDLEWTTIQRPRCARRTLVVPTLSGITQFMKPLISDAIMLSILRCIASHFSFGTGWDDFICLWHDGQQASVGPHQKLR